MKILAPALMAVLFVSGCGTSDEPTPKETVFVTQAPKALEDTESIREEAFIEAVHENVIGSSSIPDSELLSLGNTICEALDVGVPIGQIAEGGIDAGISPSDSGFIVGAAVGALCPEHADKVNEFTGGSSV